MTKGNGTGPLWVKCPDTWLDLPPALLRHALRLLRAARHNNYQYTNWMSIDDMADALSLERRQTYSIIGQLDALRFSDEYGPFRLESLRKSYRVVFVDFEPREEDKPPGYCNALQYSSVVVLPDHDQDSKTHASEQQLSGFSAGGVWGGRATDCTDIATDCTERLERVRIPHEKAVELVRDYGISSCYWHLRDWEQRNKNGAKLGTGWLIKAIQGDWELLPEIQKRREQATGSRRYISGEYGEYIQH